MEPAYQEKGNLDRGAFVDIQDLENCACTGEDGLAMGLVLELSHLLMTSYPMLASYYLHMTRDVVGDRSSVFLIL